MVPTHTERMTVKEYDVCTNENVMRKSLSIRHTNMLWCPWVVSERVNGMVCFSVRAVSERTTCTILWERSQNARHVRHTNIYRNREQFGEGTNAAIVLVCEHLWEQPSSSVRVVLLNSNCSVWVVLLANYIRFIWTVIYCNKQGLESFQLLQLGLNLPKWLALIDLSTENWSPIRKTGDSSCHFNASWTRDEVLWIDWEGYCGS